MKIEVGDNVELLRDEYLDDHYEKHLCTVVKKGTIMKVVAIAPKVCMVKGEEYDGKPDFLNLIEKGENKNANRVRTNFCNVRKVRKERKIVGRIRMPK